MTKHQAERVKVRIVKEFAKSVKVKFDGCCSYKVVREVWDGRRITIFDKDYKP